MVSITEGIGTAQDLVCASLSRSSRAAIPLVITLATSDSLGTYSVLHYNSKLGIPPNYTSMVGILKALK